MNGPAHPGGCLCGAVRFVATGPLRPVFLCHCTQCRAWAGHAWAATSVPHDRFRLTSDDGLAWFRSSGTARRGFCGTCGARLFWQPDGEARISFAAGALDDPPDDLAVSAQWHAADAGDWYALSGPPPAPSEADVLHGACLCGANHFSLPGPMGAVTACHCAQCRRTSGHFAASFDADEAALAWAGQGWTEYRTPGGGTRAFCRACGSALWFRAADGAFSVEAGCIANPTGGWLAAHIFTEGKGGWVVPDDGLPQYPGAGPD